MNPANYGYENLTTKPAIKNELEKVRKEYRRLDRKSKTTRLLDERVQVERQATSYLVRKKTLENMLKALTQDNSL